MSGWLGRRRRILVALLAATTMLAVAVTFVLLRRALPINVTPVAWPVVAGHPYMIVIGPDGCPIIEEEAGFVDAPGPLVPAGAIEIMLCTTPAVVLPADSPVTHPPRQRVLRIGAGDFAVLLDQLPDRNEVWRQWERRHGGWLPDRPPQAPIGEVCAAFGYPYDYAFVLRYPDRPPVSLIWRCGGLTSGTRTRMDDAKPHVVDEFVRRFEAQT